MKTILILVALFIEMNIAFGQQEWRSLNGPVGGDVYSLKADAEGNMYAGTRDGVFLSDDDGENWIEIGLRKNRVNNLYITKENIVYAATDKDGVYIYRGNNQWDAAGLQGLTINWIEANNTHFFAATDRGLYQKDIQSSAWTKLPQLPDTIFVSVAVDPSNGNIFAATVASGVFRSTDGAGNWILLGFKGSQYLISSVSVSPFSLFVTDRINSRLYRSLDNGDSWQPIGDSLPKIVNGYYGVEDSSGVIRLVSDEGIYILKDSASQWLSAHDSSDYVQAYCILKHKEFYYAGTDRAIYRSQDSGDWMRIGKGMNNSSIRSIATFSNEEYLVGTWINGVFYTSDGGKTWEERNNGISKSFNINSLCSDGDSIIYIGTGAAIYRSYNKGMTWENIRTTYRWDYANFSLTVDSRGDLYLGTIKFLKDSAKWVQLGEKPVFHEETYAFAFDSVGNVYSCTEMGIFKSEDRGTTWQHFANPKVDGIKNNALGIQSLLIHPNGMFFAGAGRVLMRSSDNGKIWDSVLCVNSDGYDRIRSIEINSQGHIFIAHGNDQQTSGVGVYTSTDLGNTWVSLNDGLDDANVHVFSVLPDSRILAGTDGRGVFISEVTTSVTEKNKITLQAPTFYPNPANSIIYFNINHKDSEAYSLEITNSMGMKVLKENGIVKNNTVSLDISSLQNGHYFCRIKVEQDIFNEKFVIIR